MKLDTKRPKLEGPAKHLNSWIALIMCMRTATENELWELLEYEKKHKCRASFVLRLHGKVTGMRQDREKKEMHKLLSE